MATRRLFFALWPDAAFLERLRAGTQDLDLAGGRAVAEPDLHLTLCFLGAVEEGLLPALCERAASVPAAGFELEFEQLECWRRSRLLALSSARTPAAALALAQALRGLAHSLGLASDEQTLRPHVTLARGLDLRRGPPPPPRSLVPPLRLAARRFYLAQSHELEAATAGGALEPRYARLASWPLRALGG